MINFLNTQIIWIIYINIEEYNPNKKRKRLIVLADMIADMLSNKKIVQQLFNYFLEIEN